MGYGNCGIGDFPSSGQTRNSLSISGAEGPQHQSWCFEARLDDFSALAPEERFERPFKNLGYKGCNLWFS